MVDSMINGYLSSSFDLLNVGDLHVIAQARLRCDHLVVGVFSDEYVERINGRPPVVPLAERIELVSHLRGVDDVVLHDRVNVTQLKRTHRIFKVGDRDTYAPRDDLWIEPSRATKSREILAALAPTDSNSAAREHFGVA